MGPMGAYLYFVLYVIPYPQHHDPEHRLRDRQRDRDGDRVQVTHRVRWKKTITAKQRETWMMEAEHTGQ